MNIKFHNIYHHFSFYLALIVLFIASSSSSCDEEVQTKTPLNYNGIASAFNDNKEATKYTITIYADQPGTGGDRNPYEMTGFTDADVGHSFIKLERQNADGTKTTVTVGFYPAGAGASPTSTEDIGGIFDDTGHDSDSSKEYEVTEEKFKDALTYIETTENSGKKYKLKTYHVFILGPQSKFSPAKLILN